MENGKVPEIQLDCCIKYFRHSLALCLQTQVLCRTSCALSTLGSTFCFSKKEKTKKKKHIYLYPQPFLYVQAPIWSSISGCAVTPKGSSYSPCLKSTQVHKVWGLVAGHSVGKDLTFSLCHTQRHHFNMPFSMSCCMDKRAEREDGVPRGSSVHSNSFQLHPVGKVPTQWITVTQMSFSTVLFVWA